MTAPLCDEQTFIATWETSKTAREVSEKLGVGIRKVLTRRRRIEERLGISLRSLGGEAAAHWHPNTEHYILDHPFTAVVFSDSHFWPDSMVDPSPALWILLEILQHIEPEIVIDNGDSFDGATASRHPPHGWEDSPTVEEELEANKTYHGIISEAAGEADKRWVWGNHDRRFDARLATVLPQYKGVGGMSLPNHFPNWEFRTSMTLNEAVLVKHNWHNGIHAAHNNTLKAGVSMITGHTHRGRIIPHTDFTGTRYGIECPTLARIDGPQFSYGNENPANWQSGFLIVQVDGSKIYPELVIMDGNAARWAGRTWRG